MDTHELKLRPLVLAKILFERTDEEHYLTTPQIVKILEKALYLNDLQKRNICEVIVE